MVVTKKIESEFIKKILLCLICNFIFVSTAMAVPSITIGPYGAGLIDGSAPFGTAEEDSNGDLIACANSTDLDVEGGDCGNSNRVVRTQDIATHLYIVSANNGDSDIPAGEDIVEDVVLEMTLHTSADAVVAFETMPTICTTLGGGGSNPVSSIVTNADGSSVLTCNIGGMNEGQASFVSVPVQVSGLSQNGSSYTTTQRIYSSPAADGSATSTVNTYEDNTPILISSAPAWDLVFSSDAALSAWKVMGTAFGDVGQGAELGYYAMGIITIEAARKTGIEAITDPLTFTQDFTMTVGSAAGVSYSPAFTILSCTTNGYPATAADNGSCDYERADPADPTSSTYNFTITGADLSGTNYPAVDYSGGDLTSGPYYAGVYRMNLFIPVREVDLSDGVADGTGTLSFSSVLGGFDPTAASGVSNYGLENEPGYDGGEFSNNQYAVTSVSVTTVAGYTKAMIQSADEAGNGQYASSGEQDGDAEMEAGSNTASRIVMTNSGTMDLTEPVVCDVYDGTTYRLTENSNLGITAGGYAYIGSYMGYSSAIVSTSVGVGDMVIEYANISTSGDDPLDRNGDGQVDFDATEGRYEGNWDQQKAAVCEDASATSGWHTDPTNVVGGIDGVNAVRARQTDTSIAAGILLSPKQEIRLIVPLQVRSTFNGGPHSGQDIPIGTVMANFANIKTNEYYSAWDTDNSYDPSPQSSSREGDRISFSETRLTLSSLSLTPAAGIGETASALAGSQAVWQVNTALPSTLAGGVNADNLQIISVLPPEASYSAACTAAQSDNTSPSLIQYNTDIDGNTATGYTRLIWNMGDFPANTAIPPRIFCTDTDPLAPDGSPLVIESLAQADNVLTTKSLRYDTHTITLLQIGEVKVSKKVDAALDDRNDDQVFTLSWANFSDVVEVEPPVIIDILPFVGDNNEPPSNFSGDYYLVKAPTITWFDGSVPTGAEVALGTWYYTNDNPSSIEQYPRDNVSNWCLEADFGSAGCPADFSETTAIKFTSNYNLAVNGDVRQGSIAKLTMQAGDPSDSDLTKTNIPSDIYTNSFSLDSPSFQTGTYLTSANSSVQVAAYSLGDLVYADLDGDGKYNASTDYTAPNGTIINLYKSDGTLLKTTTLGTEANGRYLFTKLDAGDYYVEIPASEFQVGKVMSGWIAAGTSAVDPDNDLNEADDQNAFSVSGTSISGLRSPIITLSSDPAPPGGGVPVGHEPTADNTLFLTDTTLDDFSNYTLDLGLIPPTNEITGTVWNDVNQDGTRQNSELGIPNVTITLVGDPYDAASPMCLMAETDSNGFYKFDALMDGKYQLIESDLTDEEAANVDYVASCPPAEKDPLGYTSTTSNTIPVSLYRASVTRQDFGDYAGVTVSGTVFEDSGLGGGSSGNALQDGTEQGIGGVTVTASDGAGTIYSTALTATNGSYSLLIPGDATDVVIQQQNLTGYFSTGGEIGSATGGGHDAATDTTQFTLSGVAVYEGLNFADIQMPRLDPDNSSTVSPGGSVDYSHTFKSPAAGSVIFSTLAATSATSGWFVTLYQDADCNGSLDAVEMVGMLSGLSVSVGAGESLCIINKVLAPSAANPQETHLVTVSAVYLTDNGVIGHTSTVVDTTLTAAAGASTLVLTKSVQNTTQGTAATRTINQAAPGDTLIYRITYLNSGTSSISDVVLRDVIPAYTAYTVGSAVCDNTPASNSCTPIESLPDLSWVLSGPLQGGEGGDISFEVVVDQ